MVSLYCTGYLKQVILACMKLLSTSFAETSSLELEDEAAVEDERCLWRARLDLERRTTTLTSMTSSAPRSSSLLALLSLLECTEHVAIYRVIHSY